MEGIGTAKVTDNAYKYNGKELNEDLGLNLSDYGARWYDAALGRWWSVDPMAANFANYSPFNYALNSPLIVIDPTGGNAEIIIDMDKKSVTIRMDIIFSGDGLTNKNYDASSVASSIEDQLNSTGSKIKVNGKDFKADFQISGTLMSKKDANKRKQELNNERGEGGTSWARNNFIEVGANLPNSNISSNEATFNSGADETTQAHEVGHLMGLRHPGDPKKDFPVKGQPGIMATVFNTVDAEFSVDGKPTIWGYNEKGEPTKPIQGALDRTKRKVLPSEVQKIVNIRKGVGSKSWVQGVNH